MLATLKQTNLFDLYVNIFHQDNSTVIETIQINWKRTRLIFIDRHRVVVNKLRSTLRFLFFI